MADLEKSSQKPQERGSQSIDPFARLRASMKKMNGGVIVRGGKLILVLDGSSSMGWNAANSTQQKCDAVKRVVSDIQGKYAGRIPIEMIEFNTDARLLQDLSTYPAGGGTNIAPALHLLQTPNSHVVLLSDGDSIGHEEILADLPRLKAASIVVNTIGVGVSESGRQLLQAIADGTGGTYVGIEADLQLIFDTFKALASKAVAALTVGHGVIAAGSGGDDHG